MPAIAPFERVEPPEVWAAAEGVGVDDGVVVLEGAAFGAWSPFGISPSEGNGSPGASM